MISKEIREAAAQLIEQDGWTQTVFIDNNGCRCLAGAVCRALTGLSSPASLWNQPDQQEAYEQAISALARELGSEQGEESAVYRWNDADDRTKADVIAFLRGGAQ